AFFSEKRTVYGFEFWSFCAAKSAGFDLDFQGDKRGSEAPSFQAGIGRLLRSKMYVIPTACSILFFMLVFLRLISEQDNLHKPVKNLTA
ncbi:MAG: hypothetical protein L0I47_02495, partial [Lactococcus lactis]|nr:hypothetical protein [Lactococcus lactis]